MRVLVLGGRGFFGGRVATALRAFGAEVAIGSRDGQGAVAIDVTTVEVTALRAYDVVINCSDTLASPPDRLHEAAVAAGILYIETTAEPGPMQRAVERRHALRGDGVAVLGLGIFPGVSNLVARAVFDEHGGGPLEVAMRFSPFTAAGGGMVALIAHLMAERAPYYEGGVRKTAPAFSRGKPMPFEGRWTPTLRAAIPETDLLHASLGVSDVVALLSPQPAILMPLLRVAAMLVPPWAPLRRGYLALVRAGVGLLRRGVFRKRPTRVVVSAVAGRRGDAREGRSMSLSTPDGVLLGAYAVAAAARRLHAQRPAPGTYVVDEVLTLDAILTGIAELPGAPEVHVHRHTDDVAPASATA